MNAEYIPYPPEFELLPISDVWGIIWSAGNIALSHCSDFSEEIREYIADEFEAIFEDIEICIELANELEPVKADNEQAKIIFGSLTEPIDDEIKQLYKNEAVKNGGEVNPFKIENSRYDALAMVSLYIDTAKSAYDTNHYN